MKIRQVQNISQWIEIVIDKLQKFSNKTQGVTMSVYQKDFLYGENCPPSEAENQPDFSICNFPRMSAFYQVRLMAHQLLI